MNKKNNYKKQIDLIMGSNSNVSSPNLLKEFFIIFIKIIIIIVLIVYALQIFSTILINTMSIETQLKIENLLKTNKKYVIPEQYQDKIENLYYIQKQIIKNDKKIKHKNFFPLYIENKKAINAYLLPEGSITITSGLLESNLSEQEIAFIMAHEIGHYSNRDHFRKTGKKSLLLAFCVLTGQSHEVISLVQTITDINRVHYNRQQEKKADLYAGEMMYKLYGTNQGGIDLMKEINEYQNLPDFIQHFADHPKTVRRIYWLEKQQKGLDLK